VCNKNSSSRRLPFFAVVFQVSNLLLSAEAAQGQLEVTNPSAIQKVLPLEGEADPPAKTVQIAMCRGEYEPVQLVVHAKHGALTNVRVSVSDLQGPDGAELKHDRVEVNPMGFIRIERPTMGWTPLVGEEGGEVPDVLLPDRPMNVAVGRRQPYYLTVRTLQSDAPGEYRGTVHVLASGEASVELPLVVRVYDVVLPTKSHLRTAFGLTTNYRRIKDADPGEDMDTLLRYSKFLLAHRVSPLLYGSGDRTHMPPPRQRQDGTWDFSGTDVYL